MASDTVIQNLVNKWHDTGEFQTFVDDWSRDTTCLLTMWCRSQGAISFAEGRQRFKTRIRRLPEMGKDVHYHIGWLVSYEIQLEWTVAAARNSAIAATMWLDDATLSDEQDVILEASFRDPHTGAPAYVEAIDSGVLTRRKGSAPILYHPESDVIVRLLDGSQNSTG